MKIKNFLMLAAVGLSSLATPMSAFADTQVANTADKAIVKKISYTSIDNKTARKGEDVKIRVDFKEDFRNQIKPGDKLVFTLPTELRAVDTTIPLEKNGKGIFGNVVITNGQAVLEFNQLVKAYDHIEGFFEIGTRVIADIPQNGQINVPMNLGTTLQVQMLELVNPITGYNPNPLGYKGGVQNLNTPELIEWDMPINSTNSKILSDMTITDTVGKGHKLNVDSLTLNGKPYKQAIADGDMVVEYINESGFKLVVKRDKVTGSMKYTTTINANARKQKMMPNHFKIEANAEGYLENVWEGDRPVKNLLALDGGIDGNQQEEHATEGTQDMPEEHVDEIVVPEDHANGSEINDDTHKLDTVNPLTEQEIQLIEETLTEEQWEILEDVMDEHIDCDIEGDHTHQLDINGESMILTDTELIEEILTPEQIETLKEIIEEHGVWGMIEDLLVPEIHEVEVQEAPKTEEVKPEEHTDDKKKPETPKTDNKKKPEAPKAEDKKSKSPKATEKKADKVEKKTAEKKSEVLPKAEKAKSLPNTGYKNDNILVLFGLLILLATSFVVFKKSKSNK